MTRERPPALAGLAPEEYQVVVAPALHAAATLAAGRGCATLFQDLPSMLALLVLVEGLARRYVSALGPLGQCSPPELFQAAPLAACVMVMSEMGAQDSDLAVLVPALARARLRLESSGALGVEQEGLEAAWQALLQEQSEQAREALLEAGQAVIGRVLDWERRSGGAPV